MVNGKSIIRNMHHKRKERKKKETAHKQRINDHSCCIIDVHQNSVIHTYVVCLCTEFIPSRIIFFFVFGLLIHRLIQLLCIKMEWWQADEQAGTYT